MTVASSSSLVVEDKPKDDDDNNEVRVNNEPHLTTYTTNNNTIKIPQLAFGCYKVPNNSQGESILLNAIEVGYRHFDTATYYGNEETLGKAIKQSGIPRNQFFLVSKVWNDAQKLGRIEGVRKAVLQSIENLGGGGGGDDDDFGYWDCMLIHWPVPNHYVDTYLELELLQQEGKIKSIGLSNFNRLEYETLLPHITIPPILNQFEISPFMYRPQDIDYFQNSVKLIVAASKAMYRGDGISENQILQSIAATPKHNNNVTPGQIMIRWSIQKQLIVLCMSTQKQHQQENRNVIHFNLSKQEMELLDSLTTSDVIEARTKLESERKKSM